MKTLSFILGIAGGDYAYYSLTGNSILHRIFLHFINVVFHI